MVFPERDELCVAKFIDDLQNSARNAQQTFAWTSPDRVRVSNSQGVLPCGLVLIDA